MLNSLFIFSILGFSFLVGQPASATQFDSVKIRYEQVNLKDEFTKLLIIKDPLLNTYKNKARLSISKLIPTANRINVVFIGDGYTNSELSQYKTDVENQIAQFLKQEPFKSYQNYFAFHRLDTASENSGVKQSAEDKKKTAFNMYYNCSGIDRLLCIDIDKVSKKLSNFESFDIVFALANSEKYGGAGYLNPAISTLAARNAASSELALHEIGHSFGHLTDEYESSGVSTDCEQFENTSSQNDQELINNKSKWYRWMDLPNVGAFKGSCYSQNFYRPTSTSKMRALNHDYEAVNIEQLIKKIYDKVKPIESWKKTESDNGNIIINLKTMNQLETPLSITWFLDEQPITNLINNPQVSTQDMNLKSGAHILKVQVLDLTTRVRDENFRYNKMLQTLEWNFTITGQN